MNCPSQPDPTSSGAYMKQRSAIDRSRELASPRVWSEASNQQKYSTRFPDEDPPFFLRRASSSSGTNVAPGSRQVVSNADCSNAYREIMHTEVDSTVRSIIDDLTVENRLLRARNRSFQRRERCNQDVNRDKLFEVSLHNISPSDAKDLEDLLSDFVRRRTTAQGSLTPHCSEENVHSTLAQIPSRSILDNVKGSTNATQSGGSTNKVDSGYASMSMTTGPRSTSRINNAGTEYRKNCSPTHNKRMQLPGVPRGLLPTKTRVTTERNKKKLVVQRLEELFTGKKSPLRNYQSGPSLNAQEKVGPHEIATMEGSREAKIMAHPLSTAPKTVSATVGEQPETESGLDDSTGSDEGLEQRPTRLLDLDPERRQIPADNVDYMRHLGMSTPTNLQTEDPKEAGPDAEGWIYLNLLMNMAQLHIMNVTADFVRDAVEEVSSKFQLSSDGRRLRWRGGTEPTRLSSLSGSTTTPQSSTDSESQEKVSDEPVRHENRKFPDALHSVPKMENRGRTAFYSSGLLSNRRVRRHEERHKAYYSPIFSHPSSENTDTSDDFGTGFPEEVAIGNKRTMTSTTEYLPPNKKHKASHRRRGMVFYNEAPFFVDFSGAIPSNEDVDTNDYDYAGGYSDSRCILGLEDCYNEREFASVSESSQYLATRKYWNRLKLSDSILRSPDQLAPEAEELESYFNCDLDVTVNEDTDTVTVSPLLEFPIPMEASCLGCTSPADHFLQTVTTQVHVSECFHSRQEVSAPNTQPHSYPAHSSSIRDYDLEAAWHRIQDRLAHLNSGLETLANRGKEISFKDYSESVSADHRKPITPFEPSVDRKIVNVTFRQLEPSPAPPPALYLSEMSESTQDGSDSICDDFYAARRSRSRSSRKSKAHRRNSSVHKKARNMKPVTDGSLPELNPQLDSNMDNPKAGLARHNSFEEASESSGVGEEEDDFDESIDMLGYAREADPRGTSIIEKEWEMERAREIEMDLDDENSLQAVPSPLQHSLMSSSVGSSR